MPTKRVESEMAKGALALGALLLLVIVEKLFAVWCVMVVAGIGVVGTFLLLPIPPYIIWEPHWGRIGIALIVVGAALALLAGAGLSRSESYRRLLTNEGRTTGRRG